jgi:hypothetical protein
MVQWSEFYSERDQGEEVRLTFTPRRHRKCPRSLRIDLPFGLRELRVQAERFSWGESEKAVFQAPSAFDTQASAASGWPATPSSFTPAQSRDTAWA